MKISSSMLPIANHPFLQAVKHDHDKSILFERNQQDGNKSLYFWLRKNNLSAYLYIQIFY